jgi:hypothetical protein
VTGGGAITLLALAMRVWTTLGELIAAGVSALLPDRAAQTAPSTRSRRNPLPATCAKG